LERQKNKGYNTIHVVEYYAGHNDLQEAEKVIFSKLRGSFNNYKVLDIGVGAGRTAAFLLKEVQEYYGVDYASEMIEACKKKFPDHEKSFSVCDAKDMRVFKDEYFDFILFSFNGIDHLNAMDRIKALKEIYRLLKKGGIFCFSSHNLNYASKLIMPSFSFDPVSFARNLKKSILIALHNPSILSLKDNFALLKDYSYGADGKVYYIKPNAQVIQLLENGFTDIEVYTNKEARLTSEAAISDSRESWIYYLCKKS
jgi:ubiquinone/menaquinone biosynthesis C-methylase UbiE